MKIDRMTIAVMVGIIMTEIIHLKEIMVTDNCCGSVKIAIYNQK